METLIERAEKKPKIETIWAIYNHRPNGQVVATHFKTYSRIKKITENEKETIWFSAEDQLEGFMREPHVALYQNGKLEKNKVLVYAGDDDLDCPNAASLVLKWAYTQGVAPIPDPKAKTQQETISRIDSLEGRLGSLESGQAAILKAITDIKKS